ncbi:MAG TPA: tryptophan synthase subunit alpha, partial [Methanomassiliicoccales archaeon]|nr:tryptophan synthase subunit alpha [Methanomassiliicoccales archaeon]
PSMPLAAGFGISRPDQVREARALGVDGVIVGSALVALALSGVGAEAVREKVMQLAEAGREGTMQ